MVPFRMEINYIPCAEGPSLAQNTEVACACEPLPFILTALGPHPLVKSSVGGVLSPRILKSPPNPSTKKASRDGEKSDILSFNSPKAEKICISFVPPLGYSCCFSVLQGYVGCSGRMAVGSFCKSRTGAVFALSFPMR